MVFAEFFFTELDNLLYRYNPKSLGVAIIRDLTMSRGSREGNNAFTKVNSRLTSKITAF